MFFILRRQIFWITIGIGYLWYALWGDRYRELGGDAIASIWAGAVLVIQQEVEEARLGRIRVRYRNAREEYSRCRALGIPGRGCRAVAKKHCLAPTLLRCFFNGEH